MGIPFNRPGITGNELEYIAQAHARLQLSGDGEFTRRCNAWMEQRTGARKALLTHSCTAALEMAVILAGVEAGDEVIMHPHIGVFVVIQSGAAQLFVIQIKAERADQVQLRPAVGAQADDVAGVGRDFRLVKDYVKHLVSNIKKG